MRNLLGLTRHVVRHRRTGRMSADALEADRLVRFRRMARFLREHSPHYGRVMQEGGIDPATARPEQFPVLRKGDVMRHFDDIVTDPRITRREVERFAIRSRDPLERFLGEYLVVHTSGSSGEMGYFVHDLDGWLSGLSHVSRAAGLRFGQKLAFVGITGGHYAGLTMTSFARELPLLYRDVLTLDANAETASLIESLEGFQPTTLTGYPTVLARLGQHQLEGRLHIAPSLVQLSGEALTEREAQLIARAFSAPIMNVYSTSECLFLGIGRQDWGAMALLEDDIFFEIHDDHLCVTSLSNRTMPLIRYRIDDALVVRGRGVGPFPSFRAIDTLVGRKEHAPVFVNRHGIEDVIHPLVFTELTVEHLARYQLHLRDKQSFELRAELTPGLSQLERRRALAATRQRVEDILRLKAMENVRFDVVETPELWIDPQTGKFRLVVEAA